MEKFNKSLVEIEKNQEIVLELDIQRTWKDDIHHAMVSDGFESRV